jgi:hypothetical protein
MEGMWISISIGSGHRRGKQSNARQSFTVAEWKPRRALYKSFRPCQTLLESLVGFFQAAYTAHFSYMAELDRDPYHAPFVGTVASCFTEEDREYR